MTEQRKQLLQLIADLREQSNWADAQVAQEGARVAQALQNILEGKGYDEMSTFKEEFIEQP